MNKVIVNVTATQKEKKRPEKRSERKRQSRGK